MSHPYTILTSAAAVCLAFAVFALPTTLLAQDKEEKFSLDFIGNYPDQVIGFTRPSEIAKSAAVEGLVDSGRTYRRNADEIQKYFLDATGLGTDQIEYQISCGNLEARFNYTIIRTYEDNLENFKSLGKIEPGENEGSFPIKMTRDAFSSKYCLIVDSRTVMLSRDSKSLDFATSIPQGTNRQADWYADFEKVASRDAVGVLGETTIKQLTTDDLWGLKNFFNAEQIELLSRAKTIVASADVGQKINARLTIQFASDADAKEMNKQLETLRPAWDLLLRAAMKNSRAVSKVIAMTAEEALKAFKSEVVGSRLQLDTSFSLAAFSEQAVAMDAAALQTQGVNNMRQLALAMLNYESAYGHFPPAVVQHDSGQVHSWRIAILPFLEEGEMYQAYRFDEPWNSEHNAAITKDMPPSFKHPASESESNACYFAAIGPSTVFAPGKLTTFPDLLDGSSDTILLLEAKRDCHWAKPEDIPFADAIAGKSLGGFNDGVITTVLCDGSVHSISNALTPEQMSSLLTIDGGEPDVDEILAK